MSGSPQADDGRGWLRRQVDSFLGISWQTSLAGYATGAAFIVVTAESIGLFDDFAHANLWHKGAKLAVALGLGSAGWGLSRAKDKNTTGAQ